MLDNFRGRARPETGHPYAPDVPFVKLPTRKRSKDFALRHERRYALSLPEKKWLRINNRVVLSLDYKAGQSVGDKHSGINVDSIAQYFWLFDRRVPMHDDFAEIVFAMEKIITNP